MDFERVLVICVTVMICALFFVMAAASYMETSVCLATCAKSQPVDTACVRGMRGARTPAEAHRWAAALSHVVGQAGWCLPAGTVLVERRVAQWTTTQRPHGAGEA